MCWEGIWQTHKYAGERPCVWCSCLPEKHNKEEQKRKVKYCASHQLSPSSSSHLSQCCLSHSVRFHVHEEEVIYKHSKISKELPQTEKRLKFARQFMGTRKLKRSGVHVTHKWGLHCEFIVAACFQYKDSNTSSSVSCRLPWFLEKLELGRQNTANIDIVRGFSFLPLEAATSP